ncbi:MAG: ATP-binding protein [Candidatus Eisenbacteria bacterium]|nr:ATP-binding protein [Candidatus Eisenbacteria bacterium]
MGQVFENTLLIRGIPGRAGPPPTAHSCAGTPCRIATSEGLDAAACRETPGKLGGGGARNPCRCGTFLHPDRPCRCTPLDVERYRSSITGPILDRIDLEVPVPSVPLREMLAREPGEASCVVHARVEAARRAQWARWRCCGTGESAVRQLGRNQWR